MTGYQEIITDPSYSDQIINFTFPHIGNVGINLEDIESEKIWLKGVIFAKLQPLTQFFSNQNLLSLIQQFL